MNKHLKCYQLVGIFHDFPPSHTVTTLWCFDGQGVSLKAHDVSLGPVYLGCLMLKNMCSIRILYLSTSLFLLGYGPGKTCRCTNFVTQKYFYMYNNDWWCGDFLKWRYPKNHGFPTTGHPWRLDDLEKKPFSRASQRIAMQQSPLRCIAIWAPCRPWALNNSNMGLWIMVFVDYLKDTNISLGCMM